MNIIFRLIGWTGTFLFSIRMFPQIYHTYISKSVKGLSLPFILLDLISAICLCTYSIAIKAYPMILCNLLASVSDIVLLILYFYKLEKYPDKK